MYDSRMHGYLGNHLPDPDHDAQFYDGVPAKRLLAWCVDFLLILISTAVVTLFVGVFTLGLGFALFPAIFFLVAFGYRTLTIAGGSGTWGMHLFGIELRTRHGDRLDLPLAALHTGIFMFLTASMIGWVVSAICIASTRYHQGIPDLILGTTAINSPMD